MQDNMWIFPNGLCISRAVLSTIIFRHVTAAPSRQQHFGQGNFSTHDGSVESDRVKLKSGRPNLASFLHVAFDWLQLLVSVLILNQCVRLSHSVNAEIMYVSIRNGRFVPYDLNRVRLELLFLGLEMFKTQFKTHWYVLVFCWIACWSVWLLLPLFVSPPPYPLLIWRGGSTMMTQPDVTVRILLQSMWTWFAPIESDESWVDHSEALLGRFLHPPTHFSKGISLQHFHLVKWTFMLC